MLTSHKWNCSITFSGQSIKLKSGDKVLLPNFTYIACANVLAYEGLIPVFLDADLETFQINLEDFKKKKFKKC